MKNSFGLRHAGCYGCGWRQFIRDGNTTPPLRDTNRVSKGDKEATQLKIKQNEINSVANASRNGAYCEEGAEKLGKEGQVSGPEKTWVGKAGLSREPCAEAERLGGVRQLSL